MSWWRRGSFLALGDKPRPWRQTVRARSFKTASQHADRMLGTVTTARYEWQSKKIALVWGPIIKPAKLSEFGSFIEVVKTSRKAFQRLVAHCPGKAEGLEKEPMNWLFLG